MNHGAMTWAGVVRMLFSVRTSMMLQWTQTKTLAMYVHEDDLETGCGSLILVLSSLIDIYICGAESEINELWNQTFLQAQDLSPGTRG